MTYKSVRKISVGFILLLTMLVTTRYAVAGYLWCENENGEADWAHYPTKPDAESPLIKNYKDIVFDPYPNGLSNGYVWIPTTLNVLECFDSKGDHPHIYQPSDRAVSVLVTQYNSFNYLGQGRFLCADVDPKTFCKTLLDVCNSGSNKYTKVRSKEYTRNSDSYRFEIGFDRGMCD